ncbi:MAG: PIN domain-containing protein [Jiangellaceae bacterium]
MSAIDRVLLDTSAFIDLEEIDLGVYRDARGVPSGVTLAELSYGLDVDDPVERLARTEHLERALAELEVLPFDLPVARIFGTLASLVRRNGRNPRPRRLDLQIAATAAAHRVPLLTRNPGDFRSFAPPLEVLPV